MPYRVLRGPSGLALLAIFATTLSTLVIDAGPAASPAAAATAPAPVVAAPSPPPSSTTDGPWQLVYRNDFTDLRDVSRFSSSAAANSTLLPTDANNKLLQKPTVASDVTTVADPAASDGSALAVSTQLGTYPTSTGTATGWTNGRMAIVGQNQSPPVRIRARIRMTPSIGAKSAVMWWPAGGGWPWEVDFAETFGGSTLTDYWGGRQHVSQHWHADLNGDGAATEQLSHTDDLDATKYHIYDMFITPQRMWIDIDGVQTFQTTDPSWIPTGPGYFSIGKALTGTRAGVHTNDSVFLDWLEIYRIALPSASVTPISGLVGNNPRVTGSLDTGGGDTTYRVDYGPATDYGSSTATQTVPGATGPVTVSAALPDLAPETTYHYSIVATNAAGTVRSADAQLTTGAPPSATTSLTALRPSAVTVAGSVTTGGLETSATVQYAVAGGPLLVTAPVSVPATGPSAEINMPLTGLTPGAAYTYRTVVSNAAGSVTGPEGAFVAPGAPSIGATSAVPARSAVTVAASVTSGNLPTTFHVDYGRTTAYGQRSADRGVAAGAAPVSITTGLVNLTPATRYHYRVVASNAAGTVYGPDQVTGTTGKPAVTVAWVSRGAVTAGYGSLKIRATVRATYLATSYQFRYGKVSGTTMSAVAPVSVTGGVWQVSAQRTLTGLARHMCYRIEVVATNPAGRAQATWTWACTG